MNEFWKHLIGTQSTLDAILVQEKSNNANLFAVKVFVIKPTD